MKFEDAIKDEDVLSIAKSAITKYTSGKSKSEKKIILSQANSLIDYAIWKSTIDFDPSKSKFTTRVYNRVIYDCMSLIRETRKQWHKTSGIKSLSSMENTIRDKSNLNEIDCKEIIESIKNERAKKIISQLYIENTSSEEIASELGISEDRVLKIALDTIKGIKMSIS